MSKAHRYAIVIGSSAGGIEALKRLVANLPADFAAPIFMVQHVASNHASILPEILMKAGKLPAMHPRDGELITAPNIYVAPPDHHLLIEDDHVAVKRGPKENRFRPSVDVLFRSAAYMYRGGTIGIVLSGALNDGSSGLWMIKRLGGTAIVQHPEDATYPSMPMSALKNVEIDYSLPVPEIAKVLMTKIQQPVSPDRAPPNDEMRRLEIERAIAAGAQPRETGVLELGPPTNYACPECHGVLSRIKEGPSERFRCHTGHAYTQDALLVSMYLNRDETLSQAVTALEESAMLLEEIGTQLSKEHSADADYYFSRAKHTMALVNGVRELQKQGHTPPH
jgi:two-component system, chemotaxis family, protein-glutamate methylesterase/glutaminase